MINPYWIEDRDLKKGEVDYISSAEAQFWKDLLEKYLHPIDENKEEKVCVVHSYHTVGYCTNMATVSKLLYKYGIYLEVTAQTWQLTRGYCTNMANISKLLHKRGS